MPYELGGRADKEGNRYEIRYTVMKLLEVIEEKIDYVILEALGDDEQGVDLWIGNKNGTREGQQCKGRNGSEDSWTYGTANKKNIFGNWSTQLNRDSNIQVSLVTPIGFQLLEDLIKRAKNTSEDEKDFYDYQIKKSGVKLQLFYRDFMKSMQLDVENSQDIKQSIQYLNRIHFHQVPDSYLKEMIRQKISYLFVENEKQIYASFIEFIIDEDILGKKIGITLLQKFVKEHGYNFKNLAFDTRIVPRIEQLNKEYRNGFQSLNNTFIKRKVHDECCELISNEDSIIIHGKAGMGKSGTTEAVINYCEMKSIPYLAIKLDKRIPGSSAKKWGEELEFPASIAHCLHSISKNEQAVLILDQLDALRWTLAHSRNALLVCSEIIEQVNYLNKEREKKISIVMVCRTIDYESDNNIKNLFNVDPETHTDFRWHEVKVGELNNNETENIVGARYQSLTPKLRSLLKIPSNLFIWCQLESNTFYDECLSTNHLIKTWWKQLLKDYLAQGHSSKELEEFKENLINKLIKFERIYILERSFEGNRRELDFLASNGFINISNHKISFAHQSILDFLLAEKMLDKYLDGAAINEILGNKEAQTPGKRYQLQMLMQSLLEIESRDFIEVGKQLLENADIRFFNKYVFFEILRDIDDIDTEIGDFILEYCENEKWQEHLLTNVIQSKVGYYKLLFNNGIIEKWLSEGDTKSDAINLIASISPIYDSDDVELIKKFIFLSEEYSREFAKCFSYDFSQDTEEMFNLRLQLYERYLDLIYVHMDVKSQLKKNELRAIKYLTFLMEKFNGNTDSLERGIYLAGKEFSIKNGEKVFSELIQLVPKENKEAYELYDWSAKSRKSVERIIVRILKESITSIVHNDTTIFKQIIQDLSNYSNDIINELILDGLFKLHETFSDFVIEFICNNFENRIFISTDGHKNKLFQVKRILEKHSLTCNQQLFVKLENRIIKYKCPNAVQYLKRRIEHNKNEGKKAYWSFWGDLQLELLSVLPIERLSRKSIELLSVLKRRFHGESSCYERDFPQAGYVVSPVNGKQLSAVAWSQIIKKKKEDFTSKERWKNYSGNFVESSIEMFANSFSEAVKNNPVEMMNLVINNQENVSHEFVDALYGGLTSNETLRNVPKDFLEILFLKFPIDLESQRAIDFCRIIKNTQMMNWSDNILTMLIEIATKHSNPILEKPLVINSNDQEIQSFESLEIECLNSERAVATLALSNLLGDKLNYFETLKPIIIKIINDPNPAVRLASVYLLEPIINVDKEWALKKIVDLYIEDFRLAGARYLKHIFFLAFEHYREQTLTTILKCFYSEDKNLVRKGSYVLAEMNLIHNQFEDIIRDVAVFTEEQAAAFLEMVVLYFNRDEYNAKCKELILAFKHSDYNLEMILVQLFSDKLIDLERDNKFLIELIMESKISNRLTHIFVKYLEGENKSLIKYGEIILSLSANIIDNYEDIKENSWGIESEVAKLIIGLYDETCERPINKHISNQSLDLWDKMFEFRIGSIRNLSNEIISR